MLSYKVIKFKTNLLMKQENSISSFSDLFQGQVSVYFWPIEINFLNHLEFCWGNFSKEKLLRNRWRKLNLECVARFLSVLTLNRWSQVECGSKGLLLFLLVVTENSWSLSISFKYLCVKSENNNKCSFNCFDVN